MNRRWRRVEATWIGQRVRRKGKIGYGDFRKTGEFDISLRVNHCLREFFLESLVLSWAWVM